MRRTSTPRRSLRRASPGRRLARTLFLTLATATIWVTVPGLAENDQQIVLPDIGDSSGEILSPLDDKRLGEAFMRSIRATERVIEDPELNNYIQSLGRRLAAASSEGGRRFTFFIVDDPTINAFAGPGGYIGVHTGLILASENESELAGVMAHEIAHVTQNHLQRAFETAKRMQAPLAAATVLAVLLGAAAGGDLGTAAVAGVQAGALQSRINFTRSNELEADRVGMQILERAGFDPMGMPNFFEKLEQSSRYSGQDVPEFLRTHPVTTSRIADTRARAEQLSRTRVQERLSYRLSRGKLLVDAAPNPQQAVVQIERNILAEAVDSDEGDEYALAVALLESGRAKQALDQLRELMAANPEQPEYLVLRARALLQTGATEKALRAFREALNIYPDDPAIVQYYAEALLRHGRAREAKPLLESYVRDADVAPLFHKLLAVAAGNAGYPAVGHRHMAEYYYLNGMTKEAIVQLEVALRSKGLDFYTSSQLEARLKELRREHAEELRQQRG